MESSGHSFAGCPSSSSGESTLALDHEQRLTRESRHAATRAVTVSCVMTLFPFFDIPVFWPILLVYFIVLFVITMRRQIGHMRKYKCVLPPHLSLPSY